MKKIYLIDMDTDKRNELIKKNRKLMELLQADLYEHEMFTQQEEGEEMFGKDSYKYIDIKDNYASFYLILTDWEKFIDNLNIDYIATDEAIKLYKNIKEKQHKLYDMNYYSDEYDNLNDEIEKDCNKLLNYCEEQLHEYEQTPDEDDAIQYADEMEQLNDYYIEEREDGSSDNVIRKDISFTECYI